MRKNSHIFKAHKYGRHQLTFNLAEKSDGILTKHVRLSCAIWILTTTQLACYTLFMPKESYQLRLVVTISFDQYLQTRHKEFLQHHVTSKHRVICVMKHLRVRTKRHRSSHRNNSFCLFQTEIHLFYFIFVLEFLSALNSVRGGKTFF